MELVRGAELIRSEYDATATAASPAAASQARGPRAARPWSSTAGSEPWRSRMAPVVELGRWELPYESAGPPEERFPPRVEPSDARFRDPYYRGRQSLRRLYAYGAASSSPPLRQADGDRADGRLGPAVLAQRARRRGLRARACDARASRRGRGVDRAALRAGDTRRAAGVPAEPARARRDACGNGPHRRGVRDHEVRPRPRRSRFATRRTPRTTAQDDLLSPLEEQSVPAAAHGRQFADASPVVVRYYLSD